MRSWLHRPPASRVAAHLDEVARVVQFVALPVGLDQGNDFGQLGDSPARTVEVESHRVVFDSAPAGTDTHFQTAVGQQIERGGFLGQHGRHVIVDAEHPAADAQRLGVGGRRRHRGDGRQVLARGARGVLRGPRTQVVVGKEKR